MQRFLVWCVLTGLLAACSAPDRSYEKSVSQAVVPDKQNRFVRNQGDPGDGRSGVRLLSGGEDALAARLLLAAGARQSIDAQYYLLHNDVAGHLFAASLLQAADRGVRVRLLLDDMDTAGYDAMTAALDRHPRIEIRLFNPFWRDQGKILSGLTDFKRINRRMHNKSLTVDNAVTIVGGRNIGNEYFLAEHVTNYADLDVMAVGPVVPKVSDSFDDYWNSQFAVPARAVVGDAQKFGVNEARDRLRELVEEARQTPFAAALKKSATEEFGRESFSFRWVNADFYADPPSKASGNDDAAPVLASQLVPYFENAKDEVQIVSAYFVPRRNGVAWMTELEDRGVSVRVVTNSLASNDVAPVYAHYAKKRKALLRGGVELFELRPDVHHAQQRGVYWEEARSGLHTKAFTIDDRYLFVGSFNWDPRSVNINTELGILIDSPSLTRDTLDALDEVLPFSTYQVDLSDTDQLIWTTQREDGATSLYRFEPTGTALQHLWAAFLGVLPIGSQL